VRAAATSRRCAAPVASNRGHPRTYPQSAPRQDVAAISTARGISVSGHISRRRLYELIPFSSWKRSPREPRDRATEGSTVRFRSTPKLGCRGRRERPLHLCKPPRRAGTAAAPGQALMSARVSGRTPRASRSRTRPDRSHPRPPAPDNASRPGPTRGDRLSSGEGHERDIVICARRIEEMGKERGCDSF
jgi:hypothetical protein